MKWPIAITTITFIIIVGFTKFMFWPATTDYLLVSKNLENTKANASSSKIYYGKVMQEYGEVEGAYRQGIKAVDLALPDEKFTPELFNHYHQRIARRSGLILEGISIGKDQTNGPNIAYNDVSMKMLGSYSNFKTFLQNIEDSERYVELISFKFTQGEKESSPMAIEVTTRVYRINNEQL